MAKERDDEKARGFMPSIGFGSLAGKKLRGAMQDGDATEGDPRLKDLPDTENDHLRGTDGSNDEGIDPRNP